MRSYAVTIKIEPWNASYHNALASSEIALFQHSEDPAWIVDAIEEMEMFSTLNALDGDVPIAWARSISCLLNRRHISGEERTSIGRGDRLLPASGDQKFYFLPVGGPGENSRLDGELRQARTRSQKRRNWNRITCPHERFASKWI